METPRGLVIVHVDGLSAGNLRRGLAEQRMPYVRALIEREGYDLQAYRCGVPSTTPFAQAGILYGDNCEIPSFRWWDKSAGLLIAFGVHSSFKHVAHKYFQGTAPLIQDGACIAACYPAGAVDNLGLAYQARDTTPATGHRLFHQILRGVVANPVNLADWIGRGVMQIWKANLQYWRARGQGRPAAQMYVLSNLAEEIFMHQLTREAVIQAMSNHYPIIYAGFYAYDETAHAYGPGSDYAMHILRHIDHTLQRIGDKRRAATRSHNTSPGRARDYELVILSDHGSIDTVPFHQHHGKHLADLVGEWLPTYEVHEHAGKRVKRDGAVDGHIELTYSGGLGHLYFREIEGRMECHAVEARFPGLIDRVARTRGIGFVLVRDGDRDLIVTAEGRFPLYGADGVSGAARDFLKPFDDPEILAKQLHKLNSFQRSGDLILFGAFVDGKQVNFEHQAGGHGSVGGEQLHPFFLSRREWGLNTAGVTCASELYPLLRGLRDELVGARG